MITFLGGIGKKVRKCGVVDWRFGILGLGFILPTFLSLIFLMNSFILNKKFVFLYLNNKKMEAIISFNKINYIFIIKNIKV